MNQLITEINCPIVRKALEEGYVTIFLFDEASVVMQSDPSKKYPISSALSGPPHPCTETGAIIYKIEIDGLKGYVVNYPVDDESMF